MAFNWCDCADPSCKLGHEARKAQQRWRFVTDDSGHDYLITAEKQEEFERWAGSFWAADEHEEYNERKYDDYRTNSPSGFTFTDPKLDE